MDATIMGIRAQWNFANTLTTWRAVAIIPATVFYFLGWDLFLFWHVLFSALTDLEGYWARMTGTTTSLGRVFDPLADKLFTDLLLLVYFASTGSIFALLLFVLCFGYDVDNTMRRLQDIISACENRARVQNTVPTTWFSKIKTAYLYMAVVACFTPEHWLPEWEYLMPFVLCWGSALVAVAWLSNRADTLEKLRSK